MNDAHNDGKRKVEMKSIHDNSGPLSRRPTSHCHCLPNFEHSKDGSYSPAMCPTAGQDYSCGENQDWTHDSTDDARS